MRAREAPKSRVSHIQAVMARTEGIGDDERPYPSQGIPMATTTCVGHASICGFYGSLHRRDLEFRRGARQRYSVGLDQYDDMPQHVVTGEP